MSVLPIKNMRLESGSIVRQPIVDSEIAAKACPQCVLCGSEGRLTYAGLQDLLFEASGLWRVKTCPDPRCGLMWLDPMPVKEDLVKAYAKYYTHEARVGSSRSGLLGRVYQLAVRGYWAGRYNYPAARPKIAGVMSKLLFLFPVRRRGLDGDVRFLEAAPNGRLLDVGCGSGEWLLLMRELGWEAEGIDFDERAVEVATRNGLRVRCGGVEQQNYASESFDAVVLNHVIEHLPDPVGTLLECARILRPGGTLVVCTPNSGSLGHKLFKQSWRGLEPPRHLHIFSEAAMRRLVERGRFRSVCIYPVIAKSVIYESALLRWRQTNVDSSGQGRWRADGIARFINIIEACLLPWKPAAADCLAAVAVK
jgi:2-polyprenyl-3-methyl-5-hydroxy-6-metoxy-1,4-benzoquinol methylase